ncbi:MAG TPA: TonB-dependent receptor [Opitutaceae bacterium]|nr:TonB-dependent receptor [Opitutaceae bacterium]
MRPALFAAFCGLAALAAEPLLRAQDAATSLPAVTVYSPSVANQSPAGTFAMPVSALRYEPLVDNEPRNMAEAQSDLTIRGDTFENTGLQVGALSIFDPQTGHYLMELPVAPAMLGAPEVLTGAPHAIETMNSTGGAVAYGWRPVGNSGFATGSIGNDGLAREEVYQGWSGSGAQHLAADADWSHAAGNGTVPFGDFHFDRADARAEWVAPGSRTDVFAGYQASFFGWPNLYTPFDSDETENLQTVLLSVDNRENLGGGEYFESGAFYRRNKDDYAFDRFAPVGAVHPYQHTTWEYGAGLGGRTEIAGTMFNYHAQETSDSLRSTALVYGPYHSRTLQKVALVPEESWALGGGAVTLEAGATYDGSNRASGVFSPVAELARTWNSGGLRRIYASYSTTTEMPSYTALDSSPSSGLFLGNPNLVRQASHNAEVGVSGNIGGWTGQAAVFYRRDDNLVDWTYRAGVFGRSANPVDIDTEGLELVARHSWSLWSMVLGYTALAKSADYLGAPVTASFYALNYARQRLTAALLLRLTQTLEVRLDNVARAQEPDSLRTAGGNNALTSSAGVDWHPRSVRNLELSLQIDNLWDSAFQSVPGVPASRRQLSFGATYGW